MDINDRDANFEKQEKTYLNLRESWNIIRTGKKEVLTEGKTKDAFASGKELKSKQKVKPMTEEVPEEVKKDDVIPTPDETPAPIAVDAPETGTEDSQDTDNTLDIDTSVDTGLQPNPEKQIATQQFVQSALKGVTSGDADNKTLVTEFGFFKADVSDPANGQFVVIAYPADMKLKDIATVVEPVDTPAEVAATGDAAADEAGKVETAPEDTLTDVNTEEPTPDDTATGDEKPEDEETLKESVRDPISVGKKNWKSFLRKLLNEGTILEESKKEEICEEKKDDEKKDDEKKEELKENDKESDDAEEKKEDDVEKESDQTVAGDPAAKKAQDTIIKEKLAEVKRLEVRVKSIQEQIKSIKTEYFEDEKTRQEMVEAYTKALAVANGALVSLKNSIQTMQS